MFEGLARRIQNIFAPFKSKGILKQEDIDQFLKDLRWLLIEADVSLPVVNELIERLKNTLKPQTGVVSPQDYLLKTVYEELTGILGSYRPLKNNPKGVSIYLLAGLQGSGKTTTAAKLGYFLKRSGKSVVLGAADPYRPAGAEQLRVLAQENGLNYESFIEDGHVNVNKIKDFAKRSLHDVLILDTAGRLHVEADMLKELSMLNAQLNPQEVLLVVDAMLGQEAANIAKSFKEAAPVSGVVLAKADGDELGGAALSVAFVSGVPILFMGTGEHIKDFEPFDPAETAAMILGIGNPKSFMRKIMELQQEMEDKPSAKGKEEKFDMSMLLDAFDSISKESLVDYMARALPVNANVDPEALEQGKERIKHMKAIIQSMTAYERKHPEVLNASRRRRIANGSGTTVQEVNMLMKQYGMMRKFAKNPSQLRKMLKGGLI
ncbi:signal recognition particle protein [Coprothermobacter platensis]|uniref:signal recognition particle protein n=1 Tax=Coprothermobacter platensis TaxID=108819 RepID=UPI00036B6D67|nr:signal recognition particle receptor subunit alpha [Coprothermobacter platensis]